MKFQFKIQQYQTDAVDAVVQVFNGQRKYERTSYLRDVGSRKYEQVQINLLAADGDIPVEDLLNDSGYRNAEVELSDEALLSNIRRLQTFNNIKLSDSLVRDLGCCSLDVEMETGTGKTYVYIKTMFELNNRKAM